MKYSISNFNKYEELETPIITLHQLNKEPVAALKYALDVSLELNFTEVSKLSFRIPELINGEKYLYYDEIKELMLVHIKDVGYFQVTDIQEESDSLGAFKKCTCYSAQVSFESKVVTALQGEYKIWNPITPSESLMGILLTLNPSWKIGDVDGVFLTRQRSINVTESIVNKL